MASARAEGVAAGRAEAAAETEAAIEQRIAATLDAITTAIEALLDNRQVDAQAAAENAVAVGAAVVRKAFPALAQRHGTQEVEAMVAEVMERIGEPPRVEVRVPPVMADTIRARLAELPAAQRLSDRTIVTGDETLREGEGRVEWATGGAGRDATTIWREVDAVLARNLSDTAAAAVTDADIGGGDPDDG